MVSSNVPAVVVEKVKHAGKVVVKVTSTATTAKGSVVIYATTTGAVDSASLVLTQW